MAVKPIPDGYQTVTPVLVVDGASELIDFMKQTLGAEERLRMPMPGGTVGHAELVIGDSVVMVADESPQVAKSPGSLHLFVENVDDVYAKMLKAGATPEMELADQFYGDRSGGVRDKFGNRWTVSTHVEDVSEDEMNRRMAELFGGHHKSAFAYINL